VEQADLVISFPSSAGPDGPWSRLPWACASLSVPDPPSQTSRMPVAEGRTWAGAGAELVPPPRADDTPARTRRGRARVDRPGGTGRPAHGGGPRARQPIRTIGHWQCGHSGGARGIGAGFGRGRTRRRRSTWRHRRLAAGASRGNARAESPGAADVAGSAAGRFRPAGVMARARGHLTRCAHSQSPSCSCPQSTTPAQPFKAG